MSKEKYESNMVSGTFYRSKKRIPTLICPDKSNNLLRRENNKLVYPVGLITVDELLFGGIVGDGTVAFNYIYDISDHGNPFWTISPFLNYSPNGQQLIEIAYITERAALGRTKINSDYLALIPVINLKPDTIIAKGDGTISNPYIVS